MARKGHWVADEGMVITYFCSECGEKALYEEGSYDPVTSKYCPNCGTKMEAVSDGKQI